MAGMAKEAHLFDYISDIMICVSQDLSIISINDSGKHVYLCDSVEVIGMSVSEFFQQYHDIAPSKSELLNIFGSKKALPFQNTTKDGKYAISWKVVFSPSNELISNQLVFIGRYKLVQYKQEVSEEIKLRLTREAADALSESISKSIFRITGQEISKDKSVEEQISAISNYYESIIACMPNNVYWLDRNCITLGCNDNVARFVNLKSRSEFPGITYEKMGELAGWNKEVAESFKKDDMEVMANDVPKYNVEELPVYNDNGEPVYYLSSRVPLHNPEGKVVGVVGISVDITDLKKIQNALKTAKEKAEEANRAKSEFLAVMSHELRTPLNAIMGMAQILSLRNLTPQQQEYVEDIYRSGKVLLNLVNDVLDFAKLETGTQAFISIPVDLYDLVREVTGNMEALANEKDLQLILNYQEDVPLYFISDPRRLRQIFYNLIGNAIKYTDKGRIIVSIEVLKKMQRKAHLKISVKDTGVGVPEDKLDFIFDRFSQLEPAYRGKHAGTGLGLAIVKQIVEILGGSISVRSALGKGTTFEVGLTLPVRQIDSKNAGWPKKYSGLRLLLIDEDVREGEVLFKRLNVPKGRVISYEEALPLLLESDQKQEPVDIVIVNHSDGLEIGRELYAQLKEDLPLMLLMTDGQVKKEMLRIAGFSIQCKRNVQLSRLVKILTTAWDKKLEAQKEKLVETFNRKILLVEDNPLNQKIAKILLEELGCAVDVASSGAAALEVVKKKKFDLIFMDISLGDTDGYSVTKKIRHMDKKTNSQTPIVAMTAHAFAQDQKKCLVVGMNDVLSKPVERGELEAVLRRWCP